MNNLTEQALGMATSPLPPSFDGSGLLFGLALFSLITMTSLSIMIGRGFVQRLWVDRHEGKTLIWAYRTFVACVCLAAVVRCAPEVAYMIAYAEAAPSTLRVLLIIKRLADVFAIVPVMAWMGLIWLYTPDIEFRIKYPASRMWSDHRLHRLKSFALVFGCAVGLALAVTIGRLFH